MSLLRINWIKNRLINPFLPASSGLFAGPINPKCAYAAMYRLGRWCRAGGRSCHCIEGVASASHVRGSERATDCRNARPGGFSGTQSRHLLKIDALRAAGAITIAIDGTERPASGAC